MHQATEVNGFNGSFGLAALKGEFPSPLPADPMPILQQWFRDAAAAIEGDSNAMVLATCTSQGIPSARVVLCKQIEGSPPAAVFYTNHESRKGRELEANPRAAGVFYWPQLRRQARLEGAVVRTSPRESDEYFATRPMLSRLGAIASRQSRPLASRAGLAASVMKIAMNPAAAGRRPPEWGGYRMLLDRIELWCAGSGRLHDRVEWVRVPRSDPSLWTPTRLCP
jgi:pyridoxamine 5'-phosphate oxidase